MNFFRVILVFFIFVSPSKANTIYNLIKIPNLKVYELKSSNSLKYFYAEKPFRLGVKKNIECTNSGKKLYEKKYKIIAKNLNKYSKNFLKKINLKYIVMCENLSISGINTAGIPDHLMKTLIIDIKFTDCSTCTKKLGLNTYQNTEGFFTEYSKTTPSEDMAEVFSHLIKKKYKNSNDYILNKKVKFIRDRLKKIDNTFKFN